MDGGQRALEAQHSAQLGQGEVGFPGQARAHPLAVPGQEPGLAPGSVVLRPQIAGQAHALAEKLFDHAQGDAENFGDFRARAAAFVVGGQDAFPQVEGQGVHATTLPPSPPCGYSVI